MLIEDLVPSWRRYLTAINRAPTTIDAYLKDVALLAAYVGPRPIEDLKRRDVAEWMADQIETGISPATTGRRFRSVQQFFRWCVDEGEIAENPTTKLRAPALPDTLPRFPTDEDLAALRKVCAKRRTNPATKFNGTRDLALIEFLAATGVRASELTGLSVSDVDLDNGVARIVGKGNRERIIGIGAELSLVLDRYLRLRSIHPHHGLTSFWLSERGALGYSGLTQILRRRCTEAGIPRINAHSFRHRFAHKAKLVGVSDENLQTLAGWRSSQMLARYGRSAATERAVEAHRKLQAGGEL